MMLNKKELRYLIDTDFLLTKQEITQKMYTLLEVAQAQLKPLAEQRQSMFPVGTDITFGKISKGEQYQHLPYLVLDYPRHLKRESLFAFRTMFWWGNEFSCSLLLGGEFWEKQRPNLIKGAENGQLADMHICVAGTPWEHHFGPGNYQLGRLMPQSKLLHLLKTHSFLKIAHTLPLEAYEQLPHFARDTFGKALELLG